MERSLHTDPQKSLPAPPLTSPQDLPEPQTPLPPVQQTPFLSVPRVTIQHPTPGSSRRGSSAATENLSSLTLMPVFPYHAAEDHQDLVGDVVNSEAIYSSSPFTTVYQKHSSSLCSNPPFTFDAPCEDGPEFPWSEYTLPDGYRHHMDADLDPTFEVASGSPNSALSGASVNTDPFDVGSAQEDQYQALIDPLNGASISTTTTPAAMKSEPVVPVTVVRPDPVSSSGGLSGRSSISNDQDSNNSAGFEFAERDNSDRDNSSDLEVPVDERYATALNIASPASFGFSMPMPDMGFCGLASPPNTSTLGVSWEITTRNRILVPDWLMASHVT
eukprot:sb/3466675/